VNHPGIELTILGTFLLIVVVFVPGGLVGVIARTRNRVAAWAAEDEMAAAGDEASAGTGAAPDAVAAVGEAGAATVQDTAAEDEAAEMRRRSS